MTLKQTLFVHHFLGECGGNATAAMIRAGYPAATANRHAPRLLKSPAVRAAIEARMDRHAMDSAECLGRLAAMARADPSDFRALLACPTMAEASAELARLRRKGLAFLVRSVTPDRAGRPVVQLHDSAAALKLIGRNLGLLRETIRLDPEDADMDKMSVDDLMRIARGKLPASAN
jgi:hypothetical protein